jgi:hypothetical protein
MHKKHLLLMLACCLIPISAIVAINVLRIPTTGLMSTAIALMCPVMMLLMLFSMRGGHEEHHEHHTTPPVEKKQIGTSVDQ